MTRVFLFGLIGLVIASWLSSMTRTTKGDGIYFAYTHAIGGEKILHLRDLSSYGNFGLGRPEGTGGLIILDGIAYSINDNGSALRIPHDMHVPAAAIKFFRADKRIAMKRPLTLADLQVYLDSLMLSHEPAAVKIQGRFARMRYRNFTLKDIPGFQEKRSFERQSIQGAMVGFYAPGASDLQGAGYHFHFIDRNRTTGGVVEDCLLKDVYIEIDYAGHSHILKGDSVHAGAYPLANVLK
jgi:acetolactate decarboxylase